MVSWSLIICGQIQVPSTLLSPGDSGSRAGPSLPSPPTHWPEPQPTGPHGDRIPHPHGSRLRPSGPARSG